MRFIALEISFLTAGAVISNKLELLRTLILV